jgi:hypothetical protein
MIRDIEELFVERGRVTARDLSDFLELNFREVEAAAGSLGLGQRLSVGDVEALLAELDDSDGAGDGARSADDEEPDDEELGEDDAEDDSDEFDEEE